MIKYLSHFDLCSARRPDRSDAINGMAKKVYRDFSRTFKILILGDQDSGKSTFINQMKLQYSNGFTDCDKRKIADQIRYNINNAIVSLIKDVLASRYQFDSDQNSSIANVLLTQSDLEEDQRLDNETMISNIEILWNDFEIQRCFRNRSKINFFDNIKYFVNKLPMVFDPDYIPSTEDILYNRDPSQDAETFTFFVELPEPIRFYEKYKQHFNIYNIGSRILNTRNKKWLQIFDGIEIILFTISLNNFNKRTIEQDVDSGKPKNLLNMNFKQFAEVANSPFLNTIAIIVFLNKLDMMEDKIHNGIDLKDHFTTYEKFILNPKKNHLAVDDHSIYHEINRAKNFLIKGLLRAHRSGKVLNTFQKGIERIRKRNRTMPSTNYRCFYPVVPLNQTKCKNFYYHFTVATETLKIPRFVGLIRHVIVMAYLSDFDIL